MHTHISINSTLRNAHVRPSKSTHQNSFMNDIFIHSGRLNTTKEKQKKIICRRAAYDSDGKCIHLAEAFCHYSQSRSYHGCLVQFQFQCFFTHFPLCWLDSRIRVPHIFHTPITRRASYEWKSKRHSFSSATRRKPKICWEHALTRVWQQHDTRWDESPFISRHIITSHARASITAPNTRKAKPKTMELLQRTRGGILGAT